MRASFFPYPRPLREAIRPPVIYPLIIAAERKRLQYQICTMGPQLFKLAIDYTVLTLLSGASGLLRENGRRSLCWGVTWKRQRGLGLIQGKCVYAVYYTVHPSVFICILRTVQNTAAMRADTQKLKCLMVDPPFRTPWVISICMFFFSPSWLDCWDNQNGSLSAGFRGSQHWLSHSSQARLTFKKKITNVFLHKGETHRKVFALSCCCIVSGHFVALFALKNQHQNLSLTITQSRSLDHGHLHCSMAPLRHWAYLFIDTHTHARTQT